MEELDLIKRQLLAVTKELIAGCRFCVDIAADPEDKTPIHCVKYSGNSTPICVNAATCLSCKEFKRTERSLQMKGQDS